MTPQAVLKLDVRSVDRLLDLDDTPLADPAIHQEAARVLRSKAASCPSGSRFLLEINVPAEDLSRTDEVRTAIRTQFEEEATEAREELKELSRKGRWSFGIALLVVTVLVSLSEAIIHAWSGRFVHVLSESLIIVAWVTLWGPAETLLFARFPLGRQRQLAESLAQAEVRLIAK